MPPEPNLMCVSSRMTVVTSLGPNSDSVLMISVPPLHIAFWTDSNEFWRSSRAICSMILSEILHRIHNLCWSYDVACTNSIFPGCCGRIAGATSIPTSFLCSRLASTLFKNSPYHSQHPILIFLLAPCGTSLLILLSIENQDLRTSSSFCKRMYFFIYLVIKPFSHCLILFRAIFIWNSRSISYAWARFSSGIPWTVRLSQGPYMLSQRIVYSHNYTCFHP